MRTTVTHMLWFFGAPTEGRPILVLYANSVFISILQLK